MERRSSADGCRRVKVCSLLKKGLRDLKIVQRWFLLPQKYRRVCDVTHLVYVILYVCPNYHGSEEFCSQIFCSLIVWLSPELIDIYLIVLFLDIAYLFSEGFNMGAYFIIIYK